MFTGLITDLGKIEKIQTNGNGLDILILHHYPIKEIQLGDSIAVNGVCSTVVWQGENQLKVQYSSETLEKTYFRNLHSGEFVNLELSLTPSSKIGGHFVTGHIDETGKIKSFFMNHEFADLEIYFSQDAKPFIVNKGSIAIDGVSLTVNQVKENYFSCKIIPHTLQYTTLIKKKSGDFVNLEFDMLGKYTVNFLRNNSSDQKLLESLKKNGFFE